LVTGITQDPGVEAIVVGLTRDIARLPLGRALTIAEFSVPGVTAWTVRPDKCGIPRVRYWRYEWPPLRSWDLINEGELLDRIKPEDEARIVLARTGPRQPANAANRDARDADRAFALAQEKYPHVPAFSTTVSVDDLLDEATARVPLPSSLWYELVVLRRRRSGRLELTVQQLFPPGARRGDTCPLTLQCALSDQRGTSFAVVARDAALNFQLVSMAAGRIAPGTYNVTATLLRPGMVRFDGLPARLRRDDRSWLDIRAVLPDRLDVISPAHLIMAVERCGTFDEVQARLDRAAQLLEQVADTGAPVTCSLVTYASHAHDRMNADEPVTVHAWRENDASVVERALHALRGRNPAPVPHSQAAQVECMLAEVTERLRAPDAAAAGRPVLVTIGNRPAFPPRVDPHTGVLPCPGRNSWAALYRGLADDHQGMTFGLVRDDEAVDDDPPPGPSADIWRCLGGDGSGSLDTFDSRRFAVRLGLLSPTTQYLPLPLAVPEGAD
jgi:hypothetical protein